METIQAEHPCLGYLIPRGNKIKWPIHTRGKILNPPLVSGNTLSDSNEVMISLQTHMMRRTCGDLHGFKESWEHLLNQGPPIPCSCLPSSLTQ